MSRVCGNLYAFGLKIVCGTLHKLIKGISRHKHFRACDGSLLHSLQPFGGHSDVAFSLSRHKVGAWKLELLVPQIFQHHSLPCYQKSDYKW